VVVAPVAVAQPPWRGAAWWAMAQAKPSISRAIAAVATGVGLARVDQRHGDDQGDAAQTAFGNRRRNAVLVSVHADKGDRLVHDPSPMHQARRRTIRRNPRCLHIVRRVTLVQVGHGI
jgi:hypothetical protein